MTGFLKHAPWMVGVGFAWLSALPVVAQVDDDRLAGDKGLPISAHAPSFMPTHLTGQHAGKAACPLCVYGLVPQLQLWVQEEHLLEGIQLAKRADALCTEQAGQPNAPVAYVIVVPKAGGKASEATTRAVRETKLKRVFFVQVPGWEDAETSRHYGHSRSDRPNVRVYSIVNRRVFKRWDSPKLAAWGEISAAISDSARYVSKHEVTDSQITPMWEAGKRLEVEFQVVDSRKQPIVGAKVSAMQTDSRGHYNPSGWNRREPRLTALAWTDKAGKITFRTIMPGPYPTLTEPSHIHFAAEVNGKKHFRTLWFEGDSLLNRERRDWAAKDEETVIVPLEKGAQLNRARHLFQIKN